MKGKMLALIASLFFLVSCSSNETKFVQSEGEVTKAQDSINQTLQNQAVQKDTSKTIFIDNDEFVFKIIENELSLDFFRGNFNLIKREVIPNKHNPSLSDTVLVYTNGIDTANFYISQSNIILQEVLINSQEITLDNDIKIGVSKAIFKSKFDLIDVPDSLVIKDFENSSYFLFTFKDSQLDKIAYKARYLD